MRRLIFLALLLALGCSQEPVSPNPHAAPSWSQTLGLRSAATPTPIPTTRPPVAPTGYSTYRVMQTVQGPLYLAVCDSTVGWGWYLRWGPGDYQILRDPEPYESEYAGRLELLMSIGLLLWIDPDPPRIIGDAE